MWLPADESRLFEQMVAAVAPRPCCQTPAMRMSVMSCSGALQVIVNITRSASGVCVSVCQELGVRNFEAQPVLCVMDGTVS